MSAADRPGKPEPVSTGLRGKIEDATGGTYSPPPQGPPAANVESCSDGESERRRVVPEVRMSPADRPGGPEPAKHPAELELQRLGLWPADIKPLQPMQRPTPAEMQGAMDALSECGALAKLQVIVPALDVLHRGGLLPSLLCMRFGFASKRENARP